MAHWSEKASGDNYSDVKLATFDVISYSVVRPEMRRLFLPGKEGMCIIFQMRGARIFCVREFYLLPEEEEKKASGFSNFQKIKAARIGWKAQ